MEITQDLLSPNVEVGNKKDIVIYHTHATESYTPTEAFNYQMTSTYRTTDNNFNVVRVGRELKNILNAEGYNVIQSENQHDYPSYSGSYERSLETATNILNEMENKADITIDIHRDALGDNTYGPVVKLGEEYAAQLVIVIGVDHENWVQNLKFAVKLQEKGEEMYPRII